MGDRASKRSKRIDKEISAPDGAATGSNNLKLEAGRRRKLDTAKAELEPLLAVLRRAGCPSSEYRKMESEGPAEKYRAVIDGETQDEPVGQRWGKVESALPRRRRSHSPTAPR